MYNFFNKTTVARIINFLANILIFLFVFLLMTYCENTINKSPSVNSNGKPPINMYGLSLYCSCQDPDEPAVPICISRLLSLLIAFILFMVPASKNSITYDLYRQANN